VNRRAAAAWRACILGATSATLLLAVAPVPCSADEPRPVVTAHQARVDGRPLRYTAEIGRLAIRDAETGEPHGWMGFIAYRATGDAKRPLMFVWNGGPGASSSLLHFVAAGPRRVEGETLVDNDDSWLSAADLVFVDPIGTGFSRPAKAEYADEFYGTVGDVASVTEFVRAWLLQHAAEDMPVYLAGESWGAGRAASVAAALQQRGIRVSGTLLISGSWGLNTEHGSREMKQAVGIADMAVTALFHRRLAKDVGSDVASVRAAALQWAREKYTPALARRTGLTDAERDAIVDGLARFTGLPAGSIDREKLTISPRQFRTGLLKDQGREMYFLDMRRVKPPKPGGGKAAMQYLRRELGYATDLPYVGAHFAVESLQQGYAPSGAYPKSPGERWNYATAKVTPEEVKAAIAEAMSTGGGPPRLGPPLPGTEQALAANPAMRVFVVGGLYDSYLPCAAGEETERSLPPGLRASIRFKCYAGGHAMYEDAPVRHQLAGDVRAFVSGR
jgi:carboxypeptidase C (cathepsin A)